MVIQNYSLAPTKPSKAFSFNEDEDDKKAVSLKFPQTVDSVVSLAKSIAHSCIVVSDVWPNEQTEFCWSTMVTAISQLKDVGEECLKIGTITSTGNS